MSARRLISEGMRQLRAAGFGDARHEAEWLLSRLIGASQLDVYLREEPVPPPAAARFFSHIEARAGGAPLQYVLGEAEFCAASFAIGPGVFIPRPETEAVVEAAVGALRIVQRRLQRPLRVLDLGTGSGCIAVTIARALPACLVVGVELSWDALRMAKTNVLRHGVSQRVRLVRGRWADAVRGTWDGVISNPPYIPSAEVEWLPVDVRREPRLSLDGGPDGMRDLLQLIADAARLLTPGGLLALECGESHLTPLTQAAHAASWVERVVALCDLAERPRGMLITRTP